MGVECTIAGQRCPVSGHVRAEQSVKTNKMRMAHILLLLREMRGGIAIGLLMTFGVAIAQPPPPPLDRKGVERRIADIRNGLNRSAPTTSQQKELAAFVERYLDDAARALDGGKTAQARQLADAADACRRPIDHLQHVASGRPGPARKEQGPQEQLRRIYFRLRLCDFFLQQIPAPAPARLLELARGFYEQAVQADQAGNGAVADEYAKAADDLTHAMESLAQAALP
jgi:hypothetical protein